MRWLTVLCDPRKRRTAASLRVQTSFLHNPKMSLDEKFNAAAENVKNLKSRPTDAELLELYALFKQASVGDNNTDSPGMFDLKGKAKWSAWNGKKGMSQEAAKEAYIAYAEELIAKYG
ncbi:acyl-CoA-binding protein homolog isoform X2 [Anabrus simplex]|uniref:acyl-CoA-binding protein homolog isoform X2 n=1 Tax=Anabrus simplex TaxID=316456 RepID=UPI0035A355DA